MNLVNDPTDYSTLPEALEAVCGEDRAITFIESGKEEREVSFGSLRDRALMILHHFQAKGINRGDQLILLLDRNEQFIDAFWACLLGGITAVPIAAGISREHRHKLFRIFAKLERPYLYTGQRNWERVGQFAKENAMDDQYVELRRRTILAESIHDVPQRGVAVTPAAGDTAFIQFSSGSTSDPKGVVLTHRNILANIRDIIEAAAFTPQDISLSWMPLTHDMGLIGFHLNMLVARISHTLMSTDLFIRRPLLWMQLASDKKANILCSPNFGYRHFLKVLDQRKLTDVDLSHVRLIFNGAEPISARLCDEFLDAMARYRLPRAAMFAVYGLAEASLAVSFPAVHKEYEFIDVDRGALGIGDRVVAQPADVKGAMRLVSVGRPIGACQVKITGHDGEEFAEGVVGHVLIRGPNVTSGYYADPEQTDAVTRGGGWLDTGDLGFFSDGELYITGRTKDVMFVNGQNFYAHDLENLAVQAGHLELGKVVVGACRDPASETEEIVVFVAHRGDLEDFPPIQREVTRLFAEYAGAEVSHVVPVARVPKTTSGKIQRYVLERAFETGEYDEVIKQLAVSTASEEQAPSSGLERDLLEICRRVLEDPGIGPDTNLFEIGANSLKLIEIHTEFETKYPGRFELDDLFDHPTLRALAAFLGQKEASTV